MLSFLRVVKMTNNEEKRSAVRRMQEYIMAHYQEYAFEDAFGTVWEAIEKYDPKLYGWEWAPEAGLRFQLAPVGVRGYIEGVPVRELRK